jgi:hypothetical protein
VRFIASLCPRAGVSKSRVGSRGMPSTAWRLPPGHVPHPKAWSHCGWLGWLGVKLKGWPRRYGHLEGTDHAFTNPYGAQYDLFADERSFSAAVAFLDEVSVS